MKVEEKMMILQKKPYKKRFCKKTTLNVYFPRLESAKKNVTLRRKMKIIK